MLPSDEGLWLSGRHHRFIIRENNIDKSDLEYK